MKPDGPIGARLRGDGGPAPQCARPDLRRSCKASPALVVLVVAVAAVLRPWGVQSQDMFGALRSAYFGFSLGGVTLSLSSMIGAAIVFAVVVFFTRLIQNWLSSRLLPQTH